MAEGAPSCHVYVSGAIHIRLSLRHLLYKALFSAWTCFIGARNSLGESEGVGGLCSGASEYIYGDGHGFEGGKGFVLAACTVVWIPACYASRSLHT